MARVLPVPAPAITATGPLSVVATARCSGSRPASSDSGSRCERAVRDTRITLVGPTDTAGLSRAAAMPCARSVSHVYVGTGHLTYQIWWVECQLSGWSWAVRPVLPHAGRLGRGLQHTQPQVAVGRHLVALGDHVLDRHVDEPVVPPTHDHVGASGHAGVRRGLRQPDAVDRVVRVGRNRPDQVSRVDVLAGQRGALVREMPGDRGLQVQADVVEPGLPDSSVSPVPARRSWPAPSATTTTALPAVPHPSVQRGQEPVRTVEPEGHLGDQHEVGLVVGQRGVAGDEAGVPPHQLDQPDPADPGLGLHHRGIDRLRGGAEGGDETEALPDEGDVVVDRLGDADDPDLQARVPAAAAAIPVAPRIDPSPPMTNRMSISRARSPPPSRTGPVRRGRCPESSRPAR